jgi:uncharacterized protein
MTGKKFLQAEWRKLVMANYIIDPAILEKYIPAKTELDFSNGKCYVSLVGFLFQNVRVKGIRVPFHINFPEVNLRFYVRHNSTGEWKRGVVFIKEIVPKPAITFVANTLFKEHYETMPMKYSHQSEDSLLTVSYQWKKKGEWNKIEVIADPASIPLKPGSNEEFITEHFWGYSSMNAAKTAEYHVMHPRWDIYNIKKYSIDCDFGSNYGNDFAFLQKQIPDSVFLAEGSGISVFSKIIL